MKNEKNAGRKFIKRKPEDFEGKEYKSEKWGDVVIMEVKSWDEKYRRPKAVVVKFINTDNEYVFSFRHVTQKRAVDLKEKQLINKPYRCPSLQARRDIVRRNSNNLNSRRLFLKGDSRPRRSGDALRNRVIVTVGKINEDISEEAYNKLLLRLDLEFTELMFLDEEKAKGVYVRKDLSKYLPKYKRYEEEGRKNRDSSIPEKD